MTLAIFPGVLAPLKVVSYLLQTNSTSQYFKGAFQDPNMYIQLPLQSALERAFMQLVVSNASHGAVTPLPTGSIIMQQGLEWNVRIKYFPHPSLTSQSIAGQVAPVFILASLMFNFVVVLSSMVSTSGGGGGYNLDRPFHKSRCDPIPEGGDKAKKRKA